MTKSSHFPPVTKGTARRSREDPGFDLGFTMGDRNYRLRGVSYVTDESPARVLDFYRGPLTRFGEVLECEHGHPIGSLSPTRSGLACDESKGDVHTDDVPSSSDDHELRVGSPHAFRLIAVDDAMVPTKVVLLFVQIPKDEN